MIDTNANTASQEPSAAERILASLPPSRTQIIAELKGVLRVAEDGEIVGAVKQLHADFQHEHELVAELESARTTDTDKSVEAANKAAEYEQDAKESESRVVALEDALNAKEAELQRYLDERAAEDAAKTAALSVTASDHEDAPANNHATGPADGPVSLSVPGVSEPPVASALPAQPTGDPIEPFTASAGVSDPAKPSPPLPEPPLPLVDASGNANTKAVSEFGQAVANVVTQDQLTNATPPVPTSATTDAFDVAGTEHKDSTDGQAVNDNADVVDSANVGPTVPDTKTVPKGDTAPGAPDGGSKAKTKATDVNIPVTETVD